MSARHLVRLPLPLPLARFPHHPCHFTGGSVTKSHLFFKALLKSSPLWSLLEGSQCERKQAGSRGDGAEPQLCPSQTLWLGVGATPCERRLPPLLSVSWGCCEERRRKVPSVILTACERPSVCLRLKYLPEFSVAATFPLSLFP